VIDDSSRASGDGRANSLLLTNGKVITADASFNIGEAVAVVDGRIAEVGASDRIDRLAPSGARVIDLQGRSVIPGLIDGHAHMDREGLKNCLPSLAGVECIDDILQRIEALVKNRAPGEWIVTMPIGDPPEFDGFPDGLKEGRFPTRHDLDRVAPDNPVYIRSIWGYWRPSFPVVSIANSEALRLAGIDRNTLPPVASVQIDREFASGEPTGILFEWNKMPVVEFTLMAVAPSFDVATRTEALAESMRIYNGFGTTSVFEGHGVAGDVITAYKHLQRDRRASVRASLVFSPAWNSVAGGDIAQMISSWARWLAGSGFGDEWLRLQGIYGEIDDSAESELRSAANPQTGWAGFHYDAALPRDKLQTLLVEAARNGIRVVGIFPYMLELFREVDKEAPISGQRWVLGHLSTLTSEEIAEIRDLGLNITTLTNAHIYKYGHQHQERLGPEREKEIVPLRSLLDANVPVSFSSDNVPVSMFTSIWQAVARPSRHATERVAPAQAITREEAIRCATIGGAHLSYDEDSKGSLEPGKLADLVVLSDDPLTCAEDEIATIVAELTIVDGNVVFDRESIANREPVTREAQVSADK
jgi:hypothetical protein